MPSRNFNWKCFPLYGMRWKVKSINLLLLLPTPSRFWMKRRMMEKVLTFNDILNEIWYLFVFLLSALRKRWKTFPRQLLEMKELYRNELYVVVWWKSLTTFAPKKNEMNKWNCDPKIWQNENENEKPLRFSPRKVFMKSPRKLARN
jgi:hypothetical protein